MIGLGRIRHVGDATVLELDGDADLAALPALSQLLTKAVSSASGPIVVDLDGLALLDDAALGLILGAAATARRRGLELRLLCTGERRRARLADTRVDRIVDVVDNLGGQAATDPAD